MLVAARKKLLYTLPTCVAASCTTWTLRGEAKVCNVEIVPYSFGETTLILKTRIKMTKNVRQPLCAVATVTPHSICSGKCKSRQHGSSCAHIVHRVFPCGASVHTHTVVITSHKVPGNWVIHVVIVGFFRHSDS